ncbi:MFS transporter [Actinocatenispora sera]|uniref:MFS transporter n=1 Tax=Actinocatenispora sera TaxID=390989 RepID=A0A810L827_9ACTN|nr:MFS transporter [Actinocatenispora sera]BCJ30486.1 MFS transporter [Actinocatenispora sera]
MGVAVTAALARSAALVASVAGAMMVALDGTLLLLAQPALQRDLHASLAQVQWTGTGYLVAAAALLVVAGRFGDRYGHRRLLVAGVLGFGAASAGIAVAPTIGWVVGLRVVQGVFGALLQPATLALLRLRYPPERLAAPVAVRTGAIGIAGAAGPLLGGVLVAQLGWRSVFVLNVPVAVGIAAVGFAVRVPAQHRRATRADPGGALLLAAVLALGVYTLVGVPAHGWTGPTTLLGALGTAVGGAALLAHERRAAAPIVSRTVAASRPVVAAIGLLLATAGGLFGALFVATFCLQGVLGLDPLRAGLRVLPLTVLMVLGAPLSSLALRRYGPRRVAATGVVLVVLALAGLARFAPAGDGVAVGLTCALLGAGFAAVLVTATGTVVGDAPAGYAGVVGGLKQTAMNVGPTVGIAVAASVLQAGRPAGAALPATAATPALLALAGIAAAGLYPALRLPAIRPRAGRQEDTWRRTTSSAS